MITVLVLASSPIDFGPLHLGKEHKIIKHSLDSAGNREQFRIVQCMAATIDDLRRYLVEYSPTIVHFCGHGAGDIGICFEQDNGVSQPIDGNQLAKLFHLVNEDVKCIVLNACHSEVQATAISEHIDFVIGMNAEIGDYAATKFAQGFYESIWAGHSYEKSFKFGCSAINTANLPQDHIPVLLKSPRLGGARLEYAENTQHIENFLLKFLNSDSKQRAALTTEGINVLSKFDETKEDGPRKHWASVSVITTVAIGDNIIEVRSTVRNRSDAINHTFYLKSNGDSFLLDWEATFCYWPIPFNTFKSLGSDGPICVRAIARLDDYYNYEFDRDHFISISLEHLNEGSLHGYINRHNKDCESIVRHLYNGKRRRIIVDIYPGQSNNTHVHIRRFASDTWIM